ncbi:MAG: hypothetical protein ACLR0P_10840 [Oscillospiraceae bacterium]
MRAILAIQVADNGAGYRNSCWRILRETRALKGHIGLFQPQGAAFLIYGERALLILSNKDGAVSEIFLPVNSKKEETANGTAAG